MLNDHDEESEQVHGCLRRNAEQDRRLIPKIRNYFTFITQFGGFNI